MMKAYLGSISGNSYKIKIFLSLLDVPHERVILDLAKKEHKTPEFLKINPRGEVPALEDEGHVIWDSAACLVYIARKYGGDDWLPLDPAKLGEVMQWVSLAQTELQCGLQYGRRGVIQGRWTLGDLEKSNAFGRVGLDAMESRLKNHAWLAGDRITIADIACFAYTESAPEGKQSLDDYPGIRAWLDRCRALPKWPNR